MWRSYLTMKCFVPPSPIFVNDTVVVSSVGFNAETTAASLRAGISRPEYLDGFAETTEDGEEEITGYPIKLLTHGFEGAGRYIQLMRDGFEQIVEKIAAMEESTGVQDANHQRTKHSEIFLLMGVSDINRYLQTAEPDEELDENPFQFYNKGWNETVKIALIQSGLIELISGYKIIPVAPSSSVDLLEQSSVLLRKKSNALVITGFVDSLTDFAGLTWLNNMGRLKSANNPVGLIPGEAVSFLFLNAIAELGAVEIVSVGQAMEKNGFHSEDQPEGKALSQLLVEYEKQHPSSNAGEFWCINNFTGEERFAMEWGRALYHSQSDTKIEPKPNVWLPNISLGDVGICFLPIAISWAHLAFKRNYAPSPSCAIAAFCYTNARNLITIKGTVNG